MPTHQAATIQAMSTRASSVPSRAPSAAWKLALPALGVVYGDIGTSPLYTLAECVRGDHGVAPTRANVLGLRFLVQLRGTAGVGRVFGPVMLLWFSTIGALGAYHLALHPGVLAAIVPGRAIHFFVENRLQGFFVLGGVVLAITGAEALYADMGHFGPGPIRRSWFFVVLPALFLNYFGQGAHLLANPEAANPFYALVPSCALYPTVSLPTAATVVASQALISGAFSLTQHAVRLGDFARITMLHTSDETRGRICVP